MLIPKLDEKTRIAVIVVCVLAILIVAGVVTGVMLTRPKGVHISVTPVATPTPSPTANNVAKVTIQNPTNSEYLFMPSFQPTLQSATGQSGQWYYDSTNSVLYFDATTYEYCIQAPWTDMNPLTVLGVSASGCAGVTLSGGVIKGTSANLCVQSSLLWGSCGSAHVFTVT